MGELHASVMRLLCLSWWKDDSGVTLWLNLGFLPEIFHLLPNFLQSIQMRYKKAVLRIILCCTQCKLYDVTLRKQQPSDPLTWRKDASSSLVLTEIGPLDDNFLPQHTTLKGGLGITYK